MPIEMLSENSQVPFDESNLKSYVGMGKESIVSRFEENGKRYVVKEVNPIDKDLLEEGIIEVKDQDRLEYLKSAQALKSLNEQYQELKEIFGDSLVDTVFVRGHERLTGNPTNYIIQREILGQTLREAGSGLSKPQREEFVLKHRDELINIVYRAKRATVRFRVPIDTNQANFIIEDETGHIYLVDPGTPRSLRRRLEENVTKKLENSTRPVRPAALKGANNIVRRYTVLDRLEQELKLSEDERHTLDIKYGLDRARYNALKEEVTSWEQILQE